MNLISDSDHFGEISLLYKCPRQATIISRMYNTTARLSIFRYHMLISDYPEFKEHLEDHVTSYQDPKKVWCLDQL